MYTEYDYQNEPVVDIVNKMLIDAAKKRASDIHMDPTPDVLNVRIRVDGELILYAKVPASVKKNLVTRVKIISGMNITESRVPQDGAIKMTVEGKELDFRVSTLPIVYGEKVVIRLLDYTATMASLDSLGFAEENLTKLKEAMNKPNGIILVTGATGSGKSTTVYSILQSLNRIERNIITVEDPVEMKIAGINQVQTMSEIGLTFASALRSILRQDPDIIMIGEIRDNETARIAVRASITGHLVLSTIHTNNSLNTIERLTDMNVERYLLGAALSGIISQRLARRLCKKCRVLRETNEYEKELFKKNLGIEVNEIYENHGCDECHQGYKGRIAVQEVLLINQNIKDAIVLNSEKKELRKLIYGKGGTTTLFQDGLLKVVSGETSLEEILKLIESDDEADTEIEEESKEKNINLPIKKETIETL